MALGQGKAPGVPPPSTLWTSPTPAHSTALHSPRAGGGQRCWRRRQDQGQRQGSSSRAGERQSCRAPPAAERRRPLLSAERRLRSDVGDGHLDLDSGLDAVEGREAGAARAVSVGRRRWCSSHECMHPPALNPIHLMLVICLTTSAGLWRSMRRCGRGSRGRRGGGTRVSTGRRRAQAALACLSPSASTPVPCPPTHLVHAQLEAVCEEGRGGEGEGGGREGVESGGVL